MRADESLPLGKNEVVFSMEGWPEARIRDGRAAIEIKPAIARKLEAVSSRVRQQIRLGKLKYFVQLDFLDDRTLLGYSENGAYTIDLHSGQIAVRVPWATEPRVLRVVMTPDKKTLFVGRTGMKQEQVVNEGKTTTIYHQLGGISAYGVESGMKLPLFEGREPTSVFEIVVSPDGRWLAFEERPKIVDLTQPIFRTMLWNSKTNEHYELAKGAGGHSFSHDSRTLFGGFDRERTNSELVAWSLPGLNRRLLESAPMVVYYPVETSSDGKWCLRYRRHYKEPREPREIALMRSGTGEVVWKTTLYSDNKLAFAKIDPMSRFLAVVDSEGGSRFLDLRSLRDLPGFALPKESTIWGALFSPDGTRFAVVTYDMTNDRAERADPSSAEQAVLWLLETSLPTKPERIILPPARASQFLWTPDGKSLVVRGGDRVFIVDATAPIRPAPAP